MFLVKVPFIKSIQWLENLSNLVNNIYIYKLLMPGVMIV